MPPLKDPVCGMSVTPQSAHVLQHEGQPVYFCSAGCKSKFAADPARYTKSSVAAPGSPATAPADPVQAGATYTCPMHPEVRQDHPGACPKCGMALEPVTPGDAPNAELADFTRRLEQSTCECYAVAKKEYDRLLSVPRSRPLQLVA